MGFGTMGGSKGGTPGPPGPQGPPGTSVTILGSYDSYVDLVTAHPTGSPGDGYIIVEDLWVWSETSSAWINVGEIRGPEGLPGKDGADGKDGQPGKDGEDGKGIFLRDENGNLYFLAANDADNPFEYDEATGNLYYLSDTEPVLLGNVKGDKGDPGIPLSIDNKVDKVPTATPFNVALFDDIDGGITDSGKAITDFILQSEKGQPGGVATLGPDGKVPMKQLYLNKDIVIAPNTVFDAREYIGFQYLTNRDVTIVITNLTGELYIGNIDQIEIEFNDANIPPYPSWANGLTGTLAQRTAYLLDNKATLFYPFGEGEIICDSAGDHWYTYFTPEVYECICFGWPVFRTATPFEVLMMSGAGGCSFNVEVRSSL